MCKFQIQNGGETFKIQIKKKTCGKNFEIQIQKKRADKRLNFKIQKQSRIYLKFHSKNGPINSHSHMLTIHPQFTHKSYRIHKQFIRNNVTQHITR